MMCAVRSRRGQNARVFAYALLVAAAVLFFCSKSSFGYPINDWSDANIYFTIGKGMTRGQVVYRDLYDHKGPLLYALHALCALISFGDFTGVYLMEVCFAALFLTGAYRLMVLYGARRAAWLMLPVLALLIYTSASFAEGDSAEELCLPLMVWSLYGVLRHFGRGGGRMPARELVWQGVLAGCVFWIKFTICGVHAGLFLALLVHLAAWRDWRGLWRSLGWLIAGFALSTLPWVLYFGVNGAVSDWLGTYLYDNLFLYSASEEAAGLVQRIKAMLLCGWEWVRDNPLCVLSVAGGLVWYAWKRPRREGLAVWLAAMLGALGVFVGGKSYPYYGLALAALAPLGLIPLGRVLESRLARLSRWALTGCAALLAAACVGLCPLLSGNMTADYGAPFGQPREETMQYRIAAYLEKDATLLNYGFMDAGFYTAAGLVPSVKYFHQTNVPLQEMLDEQLRYIREGLCNYVVARGNQPEWIEERYELIATESSPNFWYDAVYLYRQKSLSSR